MFHIPKRLLALLAPLAVVGAAFVAPAMAQAQPVLEGASGPLIVEDPVIAEGTNIVTETAAGKLTCDNVTLKGTVAENPGAEIDEGEGTATGCLAEGLADVEITRIVFEHERFNADHTDSGFVEFEYDIPLFSLNGCILKGTVNTTWSDGSSEVHIVPSVLEGEGEGCPPSGEISGDLELSNEEGEVTVND